MLKGGWDFSNTDPFATKPQNGKATITGPHVMVVGPAVKSIPGYDRTGEGVEYGNSLCDVEGYALRTSDGPGSVVIFPVYPGNPDGNLSGEETP